MTKPRIFLTRRWPDSIEAQLHERFDVTMNKTDKALRSDDFCQLFSTYDAILPTANDRVAPSAMRIAGRRTKLLATYGAGRGNIDTKCAREAGIVVTNTPDTLSECTADLAMTLLLMTARRVHEGERDLRAGQWNGWNPSHMLGTKVSGKTLGVVGFGRVGQQMARRAYHGFGMQVIVHSEEKVPADLLSHYGATQADSVDDLLPQCDFVSLHCSERPENRHLIAARRLDLMRPDALLINTSRGDAVNEADLVQALTFGTIGGAGLDVYNGEPSMAPALLDCDRLVMLPHMGGATQESRMAVGERVIQNLNAFFDGQQPPDRVN